MPKGIYKRKLNWRNQTTWKKGQRVSSKTEFKNMKGKSYEMLYGKEKAQKMISKKIESMIRAYDKKGRKTHRSHHMQDTNYLIWRITVFERDDYTCQGCGIKGDSLCAHHILSWSKFQHKRYDISNGQTLCINCHKKTNNYGSNQKNN